MHRRLAALLIVLFAMSLCSPLVVAEQDNYPEGDAWIEIKLLHWEADSNHTWDSDSSAPDPRFKFCIEADGTQIDCIQSDTWANSWNLSNVWNFTVDIPDTSTNLSFSIECKDNDALNDDECDMNPNDGEWRGIHSLNWTSLGNQTHYFSTFSPWGGNDSQPSAHADWSLTVSGYGDEDLDGISDNIDDCPGTPASSEILESIPLSGCSWEQLDFDMDGILNQEDSRVFLSDSEITLPSEIQAFAEAEMLLSDITLDRHWAQPLLLQTDGQQIMVIGQQFFELSESGITERSIDVDFEDSPNNEMNSVSDIDFDGRADIIIRTRDKAYHFDNQGNLQLTQEGNSACTNYRQGMYVTDSTGARAWSCQHEEYACFLPVVQVATTEVFRLCNGQVVDYWDPTQTPVSNFSETAAGLFADGALIDINGDDYLDVISEDCNFIAFGSAFGYSEHIQIDIVFSGNIGYSSCSGSYSLDFDLDGDMDIMSGGFSQGNDVAHILEQTDTGFVAHILNSVYEDGYTTSPIGFVDIDLDGDLDALFHECCNAQANPKPLFVKINPAISDSDLDGVSDRVDDCPGSNASVDVNGCAPNQLDSDGDGVLDLNDQCQNTTPDQPTDEFGCAEYQRDSDLDGVPDHLDNCPDDGQPGAVSVTGCPFDSNLDSDSDGVTDGVDLCPETLPASVVDESGCSDEQSASVDTDGDGLSDNYETNISGTSPTLADSDNDGLSDFEELFEVRSDPNNADSDFDGHSDGDEIQSGSDPMDTSSTPYADSESNIWWNVLCCGIFILAGLLTFGVIDLKSKPNQTNTAPQHMVQYQPERATHIARLERERAEAASNLQRLQNSLNAQQAQSEETAQLRQQMMNMQAHLNSIAAERAQLEHEVQRVRQEAEAEKAELSEKLAKNAPQTVIQNITYNVHDSSIVADEFGRVTGGEESSK